MRGTARSDSRAGCSSSSWVLEDDAVAMGSKVHYLFAEAVEGVIVEREVEDGAPDMRAATIRIANENDAPILLRELSIALQDGVQVGRAQSHAWGLSLHGGQQKNKRKGRK